jgi:type I restriction enzyme S subunit
MTDFLRLKIEIYNYRRIAEWAEFFASVGEYFEDAVTGQRGKGDWFGEVQDFFDDVRSIWNTMEEREAEGVVKLNHDSPDHHFAKVEPKTIESMGLVDLLTLLRKATAAKPEVEEYNWNTPGNFERKPDPERDQRFITAFRNGLIAPVLQRLNKLMELSPADTDAVLDLKPTLDSLTVEQFRTWNGPRNVRTEPMELEGGGQALHVPYPDYHPVVTHWTEAVYCTPFYIDPYREVPGKKGGVPPPRFMDLGEPGRPTPEESFAVADLDEVRQYMSLCLRGEKWCDGFIAGEFERGVIQAAFARLHQLCFSENDELPEHWNHFTLGEPSIQIESGIWTGKKGPMKPCLVLRNVDFTNEGRFRPGTGAIIDVEIRQLPKKALQDQDILVERSGGGPKQPVGRVVIYEDRGGEASFSNFTARLRVTDRKRIEPRFLLWALYQFYMKGGTVPMQRGATGIRNLDFDAYKRAKHAHPPLDEQQCIVQSLEAIQAARLARLKEIELERERKAALMAHLFAYGTKNEPRRDTPLGPMPESWEVSEIGLVAPGKGGIQTGPFGSQLHSYDYVADGIPVVNPTHMGFNSIFEEKLPKVLEVKARELSRHALQQGDILIARRGDFGKFCMATDRHEGWLCGTGCFRIRADKELIQPRFLALWVSTEFCQAHLAKHAIGVTMPNLNQNVIGTTPIALPTIEEQDDICNAIYETENKLNALEAEAELLDELFRATLEELMSGRLSVVSLLQEDR